MAKDYFSREVCEQLAHELVTEQAELKKHEALVKTMKEKIVEGKEQLINLLIGGKTFNSHGRKKTALDITYYEESDSLLVVVTFGLDPSNVGRCVRMTRKENALLKDYKELRLCCAFGYSDGDGIDAIRIARKLEMLKNHISLVYKVSWKIDLTRCCSKDFFEKSGLDAGIDGKDLMLEDMVY